jgi:hypothetical protein
MLRNSVQNLCDHALTLCSSDLTKLHDGQAVSMAMSKALSIQPSVQPAHATMVPHIGYATLAATAMDQMQRS